MMPIPVTKEMSIQFSLVAGGPFHKLLSRLGLLGSDGLPDWKTAFVLVLLAWVLLMALVFLATQIPTAEIVKWIVGAIL